MFYKLRLKLTLINSAVIFLLFVLLISGSYYFSHREAVRHAETFAHRLMHDIKTGIIVDLPFRPTPERHETFPTPNPHPLPPPPPGANFFFVKTSKDAEISFQSSNQVLSSTTLQLLVEHALQDKETQGVLAAESSKYFFLKAQNDRTDDIIILFHDFTQENNMLDILLTVLIVVGLICLALSFIGSFFMANRALVPVQTAWQQQKDFLSDASHELRTPLAVMQTNLDIVLENKTESITSQLHWLQNIQEEVTQMTNLVDSLLFLARADSNQQLINKQLFSFTSTAERTLRPFKPVAAEKGIALELRFDAPIRYNGDECRIKQVITILLDNAIRHTPAGGKISLEISQTVTSIFLIVSDSGEGIPAEVLDKIFDRFYQVDKARANGGAGLGLAIAKWIVKAHAGTIKAASTPKIGTTFTIELPKQ